MLTTAQPHPHHSPRGVRRKPNAPTPTNQTPRRTVRTPHIPHTTPTYPTSSAQCADWGWDEVLLTGMCELHVSIEPGTDTDGVFYAYCHDENEMIRVNGWLFSCEPVSYDPDWDSMWDHLQDSGYNTGMAVAGTTIIGGAS